jgi:hypothetical protein
VRAHELKARTTYGEVAGAKWSTLYAELPKAEVTGFFELRPRSRAVRIEHAAQGKARSGPMNSR